MVALAVQLEVGGGPDIAQPEPPAAAEQLALPLPGWDPVALTEPRERRPPSEIAHNVGVFHKHFRLPRRRLPSLDGVPRELLALRTALLDEECAEFADAAAR